MLKSLLIVAHGSRREQSNNEVRELADQVSEGLRLSVNDVLVAFLEFSTPSIGEAIDSCFAQGTNEIVILPYFLSSGNHVVKDIPNEISGVMSRWVDKKITVLPHIGEANGMVSLIAKSFDSNVSS